VEPLGERLRDPHAGVRLAATRALAEIDDDGVVRKLLQAAADTSEGVRDAAREAILARRSTSVARVLLEGLADPPLRRAAAELLGAMKGIASGLVLEALEDASDETREALGEALRAGDAEPTLVGRLQDPDPAVRRRALLGLRAMRAEGAVVPILDRLHDPDPEVRVLAATTLGELGDPRAEEALKRGFVSDPDMTVVAAIELALRSLMSQGPEPESR
jgi:HEAT repeat protein